MNEKQLTLKARLLDSAAMHRSLVRIAHEITERNRGAGDLVLVGIVRRGAVLAREIAKHIENLEGVEVPVGSLDITVYRDDVRPEDVQQMAEPVLAHRLVLSPEARMRSMTAQRVLNNVMGSVPVPVKSK